MNLDLIPQLVNDSFLEFNSSKAVCISNIDSCGFQRCLQTSPTSYICLIPFSSKQYKIKNRPCKLSDQTFPAKTFFWLFFFIII